MAEYWQCIECEILYDETDGDTDERMCNKCLNKDDKIPNDILFDLARTIELVANRCNCNDGNAESVGLDWNYLHKLNKRTQHCGPKKQTQKRVQNLPKNHSKSSRNQ